MQNLHAFKIHGAKIALLKCFMIQKSAGEPPALRHKIYHGTEMSPVKPMNASERRPAVTSAIGAPFIASGIS